MGNKGGDPGGNTGKREGPLVSKTSKEGGEAAQIAKGLTKPVAPKKDDEGAIQGHPKEKDIQN